jgi:hypothetical protein
MISVTEDIRVTKPSDLVQSLRAARVNPVTALRHE